MTFKIVLSYNPEEVVKTAEGTRFVGKVLDENETLPSFGVLVMMLNMALIEVQNMQPIREEKKNGESKETNPA